MTGLASWSRNLAFAKFIRYPRMPFQIYKTVNDRFYPHPWVVNFWINATFPVTLKLYEITGFILFTNRLTLKEPNYRLIGYYLYTIYFENWYKRNWKGIRTFNRYTGLWKGRYKLNLKQRLFNYWSKRKHWKTQRIKEFCIQEMSIFGDKYDEYYCYQFICEIELEDYNRSYNRMPWEYITINDEFDELCEGINEE